VFGNKASWSDADFGVGDLECVGNGWRFRVQGLGFTVYSSWVGGELSGVRVAGLECEVQILGVRF